MERYENMEVLASEGHEIVKTKNKGTCIQVVGDDLESVSNIIISALKNSGGRPSEYPDNQHGLEMFRQKSIEFFEHVAAVNEQSGLEKGLIPDIELWCTWLGVTRMTVNNYERKRGTEWVETIALFKNVIATYKKEMALHYRIPPMVMAFDFTNNHGYYNTSEFKVITEQGTTEESKQRIAIDEELKQSGLRWNEDTQSFEPM